MQNITRGNYTVHTTHAKESRIPTITEIEASTADLWLVQGTLHIDHTGVENTYYVDQFDLRYFCKNYPTN